MILQGDMLMSQSADEIRLVRVVPYGSVAILGLALVDVIDNYTSIRQSSGTLRL